MERSAWTDERLDDMTARNESQFELLRADIRGTRTDLQTEMREMRMEMRGMRTEMQAEFGAVRRDMFHGAIALFAALVAMYATTLVHSLS